MTPEADLTPSGVSTSTVRRYLWPGRLMRIWSPMTSTANSASGPIHLKFIASVPGLSVPSIHRFAQRTRWRQTRAPSPLDPGRVWRKSAGRYRPGKGTNVTVSAYDRLRARNDLAWSISVGGISVVLFAALLLFAWYFAATLFLIFAGMLLGVALNAMTAMLGRVVRLPHPLRLTIVCLVLATLLSGVVFLGGATIAQQATALSDTIKSQLVDVKAFLERNG